MCELTKFPPEAVMSEVFDTDFSLHLSPEFPKPDLFEDAPQSPSYHLHSECCRPEMERETQNFHGSCSC